MESEITSVDFNLGLDPLTGLRGVRLDIYDKIPIGRCTVIISNDKKDVMLAEQKGVHVNFAIRNLDHAIEVLNLLKAKKIDCIIEEAL